MLVAGLRRTGMVAPMVLDSPWPQALAQNAKMQQAYLVSPPTCRRRSKTSARAMVGVVWIQDNGGGRINAFIRDHEGDLIEFTQRVVDHLALLQDVRTATPA